LPTPSNTDEEFIDKLANAIKHGRHFFNIAKLMEIFIKLAKKKNQRIPKIEDVILKKDYKTGSIISNKFSHGGYFRHYAGMFEICEYVKDIIKGNWPEFEKKIDDDYFNAMYYYLRTGLKPVNSNNKMVKDTFSLNKEIQETIRNNLPPSPELRQKIKNYLIDAKKLLKGGELNFVVNMVLKPYTNKLEPLKSLMDNKSFTRHKDVKMT
jgi:hypothetical protein